MKNTLRDYLQKLSKAGRRLDFIAARCRYGKFTIFCLAGPEENIIHAGFTAIDHQLALKQLVALDGRVACKTIRQEDFQFDKAFREYFTGKKKNIPIRIDSPFIDNGTQFQQRIWRQIAEIPYGSCITYRHLAEKAGCPGGARAAGTACGANPLPIIIPCHRVVAQNGIGGFGGGIALKESLLALEHARGDCRR